METRSVVQDGQGSLARYVLSDEESRRIFEQEIVPAELSHLTGPEDDANTAAAEPAAAAAAGNNTGPVAVLLVGQTGAGKTRTAPLLAEAVSTARQRRPRAHLIADTYKTYHPAYAALAAQSPALASPATGPDARRWLAMACALAASRGADCIVESACRHPADFQDLVRLFTSSSSSSSSSEFGYAVRVAVLAVPEALSRLGILVRFHHALPEARSGRLPLRLTPRAVHDASFAGLLDAAAWLDRLEAAPVAPVAATVDVVVLRRGNRVAYSYCSRRHVAGAGAGAETSAIAPALLRERRQPLTPEELRLAREDVEALRRLGRPQLEAELAEVEALLRDLAADADEKFPDLRPFDPEAFVKHGRCV